MAAEINFKVGESFKNVDYVKNYIKDYCFVIVTNNQCKHGVERASKSSGKRINLHVNFVGCSAKVKFFKSAKDGEYL